MTSTKNADPSVVLVHGAYADGSSWSEVIRRLQDAGVTAAAVTCGRRRKTGSRSPSLNVATTRCARSRADRPCFPAWPGLA